jgi:D-alanyl-D-alanine carboxypeptidase (penicillin-binding protein 5/6)
MSRTVSLWGKALGLALCVIGLGCRAAAQYPPAQPSAPQSAQAYIVVDSHSKKILLAANAGRKLPVASLTKIATACLVLDWAERTGADLGQRAVVPPSAAGLGPNPFNFVPGDALTLRDALSCAMMGSDNIAAETLAWHVGADLLRRTGKGRTPYDAFVRQMNSLAGTLRMDSTKFLNPHGLDTGRAVPLSTAADMARLTLYAQKKPAFSFYTSQAERRVTVYRAGTQKEMFLLKNTNTALGRAGIDGVKTGTTARAGQCLILSAPRKNIVIRHSEDNATIFPRRLVVVVLGSQNRFPEGEALLNQGWARYDQWHQSGRTIATTAELLDPQPAPQ